MEGSRHKVHGCTAAGNLQARCSVSNRLLLAERSGIQQTNCLCGHQQRVQTGIYAQTGFYLQHATSGLGFSTKTRTRDGTGLQTIFTFQVCPRLATSAMLTLVLTVCLLTLVPAPALGAGDLHGQYRQPPIDLRALAYLQKFGYLPRGELETGNLQSPEMVRQALRNFQRMARLPVTGQMDAATWRQMEKPRCGNAESVKVIFPTRRRKRFVIAASKWKKSLLTYRILNFTPDLHQAEVRDSLVRAFRVWTRVTNLDFREKFTGPADIMIRFTRRYHHDGYPFDGKGSVLAHAFYPGSDRGGDIHFDEDETWTFRGDKGVNLFSVATHEIGHSLGLSHSQVPPALMYPWYNGDAENLKLHSDDIVAIQYLYGSRLKVPGEHSTRPVPSTLVPTRDPSRPATKRHLVVTTRTPRRTRPPTKPPTIRPTETDKDKRPILCKLDKIDAIAIIRREIFVFAGLWFWRVPQVRARQVQASYFHDFWFNLPKSIKSIDAVDVKHDGTILFFVGDRYFEMTDNHLSRGFPKDGRPLTDLGFPSDITKIDSAFRWSYNGLPYFISGDMYWKYNEHQKKMYPDYPRDMSMWSGVPLPVDATFTYKDKTYFFHGRNVWRFNDIRMSTKKGRWPKPWTALFLPCNTTSSSAHEIQIVSQGKGNTVAYSNVTPGNAASHILCHNAGIYFFILIVSFIMLQSR